MTFSNSSSSSSSSFASFKSFKTVATSLAALGALTLSAATPAITHADSYRNPNAGHLVQLYTRPQKLTWTQTATLSGACPDGGQIVQDPTNYLAVPYVPRASATNVFSTLVDGGLGSSTISVSFNNGEQAQEIAAFEYTCLVPGPAPANAAPLASLTQRRSHW
jgi:hypothetical protein